MGGKSFCLLWSSKTVFSPTIILFAEPLAMNMQYFNPQGYYYYLVNFGKLQFILNMP